MGKTIGLIRYRTPLLDSVLVGSGEGMAVDFGSLRLMVMKIDFCGSSILIDGSIGKV